MTAKNLQAKRQPERIGLRSQMKQAKVLLSASMFLNESLASVSMNDRMDEHTDLFEPPQKNGVEEQGRYGIGSPA